MVNYKCPRCGYETHIKTIYVRHLERKLLCKPIISENNLENEYIKFNITEKINIYKKQTKIQQFDKNIQQMFKKWQRNDQTVTNK